MRISPGGFRLVNSYGCRFSCSVPGCTHSVEPSDQFSFFQMGTSSFKRSMAWRQAANASANCGQRTQAINVVGLPRGNLNFASEGFVIYHLPYAHNLGLPECQHPRFGNPECAICRQATPTPPNRDTTPHWITQEEALDASPKLTPVCRAGARLTLRLAR